MTRKSPTLAEMITTERVASANGESSDGAFGVWHRSFARRPELTRMVAWTTLRVFVAKKGGPVKWDVLVWADKIRKASGDCPTWETSMRACESAAREMLEEGLSKLPSVEPGALA